MTNKIIKPNKKKASIRKRVNLILWFLLIVGFGTSIFRIGYLQFGMDEVLKKRAVSQQFSSVTISAKRGTIYDRNGKVLAQSASVWKVALDPSAFKSDEQKEYTSKGLAGILGMEQSSVLDKINQTDSQYVLLKNKIEGDVRDQILEFIDNAPDDANGEPLVPSNGINFYDDYKRYYPYGSLASSVIGVTGSDGQGLSGLEYEYNSVLQGQSGRLITAQNANGDSLPFEYKQNIDAQDGTGLVLTIDETIQSIAEKYMEIAIEENKVYNRGGCIIIDPNTGEILANATVGGFDLNNPFELNDTYKQRLEEYMAKNPDADREAKENELMYEMWRNKTVSDTYYPGSVFKMVTASMALQEGLITENSLFTCNRSYNVYGINIHCHSSVGHGTQTFEKAICNSCNPALIQIGQLIGEETFWKYYQAFGFSECTGVDLPGESDDIFFSEDGTMGPVDLAVASFGQNFSITPMQMAVAACAVANGGYIVQPHLVKEMVDSEGNVTQTMDTTVKRQVISEDVSDRMCEILEQNAIDGGAVNAYISGYRVAGKTGTSEKKSDSNGDGIDDYISSFCGFAPANNAQVLMLVFFDTPLGDEHYGSKVAAPVFANVMKEVLPYLEVEQQYTEEELANIDTKADNYVGLDVDTAEQKANEIGLSVKVKGEGDTVVSQMPEAGSSIPNGGTVVLYTEKDSEVNMVNVPDLVGLSVSEAKEKAEYYGVNISLDGVYSGDYVYSVSQSIPYKEVVPQGTVITVTFKSVEFSD